MILGRALDARGNVALDAAGMSSVAGVFAAGDISGGHSLTVRAIAPLPASTNFSHAGWYKSEGFIFETTGFHLKPFSKTASCFQPPCTTAKLFPSGEIAREFISSSPKSAIFCGIPASSGCSQRV